jgi:type I restriction enzyme S subunit
MSDARPGTLGRYFRVKHGFAFKGEYFTDEVKQDVLVTPGNFAIGGGFQEHKLKYYAGPVPEDYVLKPGDLVVTMTDLSKAGDTLGYPALIPDSRGRRYLHNQRVGLVEINNPTETDKRFLFYRLCADDYRHHVLATASGSTVRHTSPTRIQEFETTLPNIDDQRAISEVLGALDDKIEQSRRTSFALERLLRAVFGAWFVDFDPVKAKAATETDFPSMAHSAFQTLPDSFVDSAIGPIPTGWRLGSLGDVATERRDTVQPGDIDPMTPYIGLEHMPRRDIALREWERAGKVTSGKARFRAGEILFGKLRPYFHKVGVAPVDGVCSTDIVVATPEKPMWFAFALCHMSSDEFVAHTNACSTGTKMPRTNWRDMARYAIALPPDSLASAFDKIAAPIIESILTGIFECRELAVLRDLLLPRLIKGEVRVEAAQA